MTGYHYTTWSYWQQIREQGLIPYPLNKEEITDAVHYNPRGIWLWKNAFKGTEHMGAILYQVGIKGEAKVVVLAVEYQKKQTLLFQGHEIHLTHDGIIGNWQYHNNTPSVILTESVSPENIRLLRTYNLRQLLK